MPLRSLALVFLLLTTLVRAQDPVHRRWTVKDGLPSNRVYCAIQDRDGFLWFGTDAGVARCDGQHMDRITVADGLPDLDVFMIMQDQRGRVWFLTGNGRPGYWLKGRVHTADTDTLLQRIVLRSGIRSFYEDRNGLLWFGGLAGELVTLAPNGSVTAATVLDTDRHTPGGRVAIGGDAHGNAVVFCNAIPAVRTATGWTVDMSRTRSQEQMGRLDAYPDGRVLQTLPDAVRAWRQAAWTTVVNASTGASPARFSRACAVAGGDLWIALEKGGVRWLTPQGPGWRSMRPDLFTNDLVNDVVRDREGNHWICTAYGGAILCTASSAGSAFHTGVRGGKEEVLTVRTAPGAPGMVWCGTNQGDLYRLDSTMHLVDLSPPGPYFSRVNDLLLRGREVWVAMDHGTARVVAEGAGWSAEMVLVIDSLDTSGPRYTGMKALALGHDGRIRSSYYGLYAEDNSTGQPMLKRMHVPGIPNNRIYAPLSMPDGALWFEEERVLHRLGNDGVRTYPGLRTGIRITDLARMGDTLVVGTAGAGVRLLVNGREVGHLTSRQGLVSDQVRHLCTTEQGLFVATPEGAAHVRFSPGKAPTVRNLTMDQGLASNNVRDVAADAHHIYLALSEGLCVLPLGVADSPTGAPVPYFRSIRVNDGPYRSGTLRIRQGRDRFQVQFAAIHFALPQAVRLEYRLESMGEWLPGGTGQVEFATLGSGPQALLVRAALAGGAWSDPIRLEFTVVPPLWRTPWFVALLILLLATLMFIGLRWLAGRRYRIRMARLRQMEALNHERQRIAMDLHDDLGAELGSLLLLTRMEHAQRPTSGLDRMEQVTRALTEKVNEVIWSSDPGHDTVEATVAFIERHVADQCRSHGLGFRRQGADRLPTTQLPAGLRRDLFLVMKELVANALKHAGASTLVLTVELAANALVLTLADDGRGFPVEPPRGGNGLANMRRRMQRLGGSVSLGPAEGGGTMATVHLPLINIHTIDEGGRRSTS